MEGAAPNLPSAAFRRLHEGSAVRSAAGIPLVERIQAIWSRRDVLRMLTERELRAKYSGSVLGYAWSLIEPTMLILTYFMLLLIFHRRYPSYPLFIGSTILPWLWFSQTFNASTTSLRRNSRLITSIALPREIYPLSTVAEKTIEFVFSLPVLVVVAWIYGIKPSPYAALLPVVLVFELLLCTGIALLLSSLNTVLLDVQRGAGIVVRLLFYLTPVLYPLYNLHGPIRRYYSMNPLVGIFETNRAVWFPAFWTGWKPVEYSAIGSVAIFLIGFAVFVRVERTMLKEL